MRAFRAARIDEHQPRLDEFLYACAADAAEARGNSLIEALASLGFGNDKFVKQRFAALAHAEIVAAVRNYASGRPYVFQSGGVEALDGAG